MAIYSYANPNMKTKRNDWRKVSYLMFSRLLPALILVMGLLGTYTPTQALGAGDLTVNFGTPFATLDSNKPCTDGPMAMYIELEVTNPVGGSAGDLNGVSITLSDFSNANFTFDAGENKTRYIGNIPDGETKHLWWFVNYVCTHAVSSTFTATISDSNPGTVNYGPYTITTRSEISALAGGTLVSQTIGGPGYSLGQVIPMTVVYSFGNVGSNQDVIIQPAGNISHNGGCFRLVGVDVTDTPDEPVDDPDWVGITAADDNDLYFSGVASLGTGNEMTVDYYFLYQCSGTTSLLQPFSDMGSGTQYKYTGNFPFCSSGAACEMPAGTNPFTITKSANPTSLPTGGTVTYTVTISNTSAYDSYISQITDVLPASVSYIGIAGGSQVTAANSSSVPAGGATGTITWVGVPVSNCVGGACSGSYLVPGNGTLTLVYTASVPNTFGGYTNTVTAQAGNATIGPARSTVMVGTPPTIAKSFNPATIAFPGTSLLTITLTNPNTTALTGGTFTDNLPEGMTISGNQSAGGTCAGAGGNNFTNGQSSLTFSGLTIPGGTPSGSCTVTVTVTTNNSGTFVNTIPASALTTTQGFTNVVAATDTLTVTGMTVSKTSSANGFVGPGDVITYTITITNPGALQTNVVVTDPRPAGTNDVFNSTTAVGYTLTSTAFNYRDQFGATSFSNSDGTADWTGTPWDETNDNDVAGTGKIQINAATAGVARFDATAQADVLTLTRPANLAGATSATLTYTLTENANNNDAGDYVQVQISTDGGATWPTTLATVNQNFTTYNGTHDILAYSNADTQIRFVVHGYDGGTNYLAIDNVNIAFNAPAPTAVTKDNNPPAPPQLLANGTPPSLVTAGDAFVIPTGGTMTVTYQVTADALTPGQATVVNTVSVTSTETPTPVTDTTTDVVKGNIVVDKVTVPGGDAESFTFTTTGTGYTGFSLTDAAAPNNQYLVPGTYSVAETVPAGWDLTSAICVSSLGDTETIANIELDAAETVTCTFTNTRRSTIVVDKVTVPAGSTQSFDFTVTGPGYNDFSLTDAAAPNNQNLAPATYSVAETVPAGWNLTSATCSDGSPITAIDLSAGETVTCTFTNTAVLSINAGKTANPTSVPETGQSVVYTVTVENTSPVQVTLNSLTDDLFGNITTTGHDGITATTCATGGTIAVGDTYTCTFTATVAGDFPGSHVNTVTAQVSNGALTASDTATATVTFTDVLPDITVTKTAQGAPASVPETGGNVTFTYVVTNNSTEAATITVLSDNQFGALTGSPTCQVGTVLAGGASCTFDAIFAIPAGDVPGTHVNTFSATVTDGDGNNDTATDDETVTYTDVLPDITVSKTAGTATVPETGGNVTFTYTVTNNSLEAATITVLTDNQFGALTGSPTCQVGTVLAGGASCTFDAIFAIPAGDVPGTHVNTFSATVTDGDGNTDTATDNETVTYTDILPDITVSKTAGTVTVPETGGNVTFTYTVTNNSLEAATITVLTDNQFGALTGSPTCQVGTVLAGGASCTFDAIFAIPAGDVPGTHVNTFSATVTDGDGNTDTATDDETVTYTDVLPDITVSKTAGTVTVPETGGNVTFTYTVTNNSTEAATITVLSDNQFGALTGSPTCQVGTVLAGGASCTFDATFAIPAGDVPGTHVNTFSATVTDGDGNTDTATDDETVTYTDVLPDITVSKTAGTVTVPETGGNVTFTYTVTNNSLEAATITVLTDNQFGALTGSPTCQVGTVLAGGASCTFDAIFAIPAGDVPGTHVNTFSATVTDGDGNNDTATDDETVTYTDVLPDITVSKTAGTVTVPETGGNVTFTYTVTNNSLEAATITVLTDNQFGALTGSPTCQVGTVLAGGASCTFDATFAIPAGDVPGTHVNTFSATVTDGDGNTDTATDDETVTYTDILPDITVTKNANPTVVPEAGAPVVYTIVVTNNSAEPATLDSLTDDLFNDITTTGHDGITATDCATGETIAASGGIYTCTFTATISGTAGIDHVNTVTAVASDGDGNTDTATDDATVSFIDAPVLSIDVTKTADDNSIPETGQAVTFTVDILNTGNLDATLDSLTDSIFNDITTTGHDGITATTCATGGTIAATVGTYTCTFTATVSGDFGGPDHVNTLTAQVSNGAITATDTDDETITFEDVIPTVDVTKSANPTSLPEPGGSVVFTVAVQNTSDESVVLTSLSDTIFNDITTAGHDGITATTCGTGAVLLPGDTYTCTFTAAINGNAGDVHLNEVAAVVTDDEGSTGSDTDDATVTITDLPSSAALQKTANPPSVLEPGDDVTFTVRVDNTSAADVLTLTVLSDNIYGDITDGANPNLVSTTCSVPQTINPGAFYECEFVAFVGGADGDSQTDTVTATLTDDDGNTLNPSDDATVDVVGALIGVAKRVVGIPIETSPGVYDVTYEILVENYGASALSALQVTDDLSITFPLPTTFTVVSVNSTGFTENWPGYDGQGITGDIDLLTGVDTLAIGGSGTITLVVEVIPAEAGPFDNVAIASGRTPAGTQITDRSQDGIDPDPDGDDNPTNNNDPTSVSFGPQMFDPPFGLKLVDATGEPVLQWTMVWINNTNIVAVNAAVHDPIPVGTAYVASGASSGYPVPAGAPAGSTDIGVSCTDTSVVTFTTNCYYEGPTGPYPRGRIIWEGTLGPDFGVTDPALAVNDISITFSMTVASGITSVENTATIDSDLNGDGDVVDPGEQQVAQARAVWQQQQPVQPELPPALPDTGFAPGRVTEIGSAPAGAYDAGGNLRLVIPMLRVNLPIVGVPLQEGNWDVTWLWKQAGWLEGTAFPTLSGNSVLTAHVYDSNGLPGPFVNLGSLKWGDRVIVMANGMQYIYEVRTNEVVAPNNVNALKHEEKAWLTLVTCRQYDEASNTYKQRVVVRAVLINVLPGAVTSGR